MQLEVERQRSHSEDLGATAATQGQAATAVCLVFDCSASMEGPKLEHAVAAARHVVSALEAKHRLSLVGFGGRCHVLIDGAATTSAAKPELSDRIERLRSIVGGSTNLAAGIRVGTGALLRSSAASRVMIVLSDGQPDSRQAALAAAHHATAAGVRLFAVGVGAHYDAEHLLALVEPSGGAVFGTADAAALVEAFAELWSMARLTGSDETPPPVAPQRHRVQRAKRDPEPGGSFDVVLLAAGPQLIRTVREVRAFTGGGIREAMELVKTAPVTLRQAIDLAEAKLARQHLESGGGRVELRPARAVA